MTRSRRSAVSDARKKPAKERISVQLKTFAAHQYRSGQVSLKQLSSVPGLSADTILRASGDLSELGFVPGPHRSTGRPSKATAQDKAWVLSLFRHRPTLHLREVVKMLRMYANLNVHESTVSRWLKTSGLTVKKLSKEAVQRDAARRGAYAMKMAQYTPQQLVFADETHFNRITGQRVRGWAPTDQRAQAALDFNRGGKWTLLPALTEGGLIAPLTVEGTINRERFLFWLEYMLLPRMTPYPGPRSVLVLDNCSIHKGDEVRDLVEAAGCHLVFLPPYSPDFNPIEMAFSAIKARLRKAEDASRSTFLRTCSEIRAPHARSYFRYCGYARAQG